MSEIKAKRLDFLAFTHIEEHQISLMRKMSIKIIFIHWPKTSLYCSVKVTDHSRIWDQQISLVFRIHICSKIKSGISASPTFKYTNSPQHSANALALLQSKSGIRKAYTCRLFIISSTNMCAPQHTNNHKLQLSKYTGSRTVVKTLHNRKSSYPWDWNPCERGGFLVRRKKKQKETNVLKF